LRQVLLNLVTNALKFTPSGGTVTLRAGLRPQGFAFEVEDTGIGIPAEHLSRIWQPFFQSDATLARQRHGAGLGLAIVRHFVEAHDGEVYIDSEPGQGTRVGLLLPPTRIEMAAAPQG
jgi:signal transduction histidine kinase